MHLSTMPTITWASLMILSVAAIDEPKYQPSTPVCILYRLFRAEYGAPATSNRGSGGRLYTVYAPPTFATKPPATTTAAGPCAASVHRSPGNVSYKYIGCYMDKRIPRVLPDTCRKSDPRQLTNEACFVYCYAINFSFFGTEAGHECRCGDALAAGSKKKSGCTHKCPGNSKLRCGGRYRTSIYRINWN